MGELADRATTVITSSRLSPVEKNILIQTFLVTSCDGDVAAREILRRVGGDDGHVPLEEALRGLKHDWYRVLELLSEKVPIDAQVQGALLARDRNQCCLTGPASQDNAEAFHILSPGLLTLWDKCGKNSSQLKCLAAFITPESAELLRSGLSQDSLQARLGNAMLLSPALGQAFWRRDIWLAPDRADGCIFTEGKPKQGMAINYNVYGVDDLEDSDESGHQPEPLFECTLRTNDQDQYSPPNPLLLKIHSQFAKAPRMNDMEREVAKPWPPKESHSYWNRKWQLFFRAAWHFVPAFIRSWAYRQLIYRGQQSAISDIVYSLPLGLYAKFCGDAHGEPAALKLLEEHAPKVLAPLFVDLLPLVPDGKPWLIMTRMPGQRVDEVIHRMSYAERHQLADDLAACTAEYRNVPNISSLPIASASGGRIQDPRASSNGCGPYGTEAEFTEQVTRGCMDNVMERYPNAFSVNHPVTFTHADLFPSNILVDAGKLSGIVDWQFAGFYPSYWECTKAMRGVKHAEHYQAIFRRMFGNQYEEEVAVETFLSGYFPIWGPPAPGASQSG